MPNRTDVISLILLLFAGLASVTTSIVGFETDSPVAIGGLLVAISFMFLYPAFWAFKIRRALAVRLYRNQALGIGLISVAFLAAVFDDTGTTYSFALLLIFYWIDVSFLAARRSDPLLRDTLHWSKLRIILWALGIISVAAWISGIPPIDTIGKIFVATLIPASGVALIAVALRRSRNPTLSRNLAWFGLFAMTQLVTLAVAVTFAVTDGTGGAEDFFLEGYFLFALARFLGLALGGFFLYKSARSLVPLNRLPSS